MNISLSIQDSIGLVMPFIIDFLNFHVSNAKARFLISWGICIVAGLVLHLDELKSGDWSQLVGHIAAILLSAQAVYKLYWENSGTRDKVLDAYEQGVGTERKN